MTKPNDNEREQKRCSKCGEWIPTATEAGTCLCGPESPKAVCPECECGHSEESHTPEALNFGQDCEAEGCPCLRYREPTTTVTSEAWELAEACIRAMAPSAAPRTQIVAAAITTAEQRGRDEERVSVLSERVQSFCVECGPNVRVDEDGCCVTCGCQAVGDALPGRMYHYDSSEK